jgi:orotate phosphoribosyltransferase
VTSSFPDRATITSLTARMLLQTKALHFNADTPFKFTSGWASPVYVDCRKLISFPQVRSTLMEFAVATILDGVGFDVIDAVAGGETAGIPYAAFLADRLHLPMLYVRKKPKGFGRNAQIEGEPREGDRVLLVEDLSSDGRSKVVFADALRTAGCTVEHAFVVFSYGIFPHAAKVYADLGVTLHHLATWWDVLRYCRDTQYFEERTLDVVEAFLNDPVGWSGAHGGISEPPAG